MNLIVGLLKAFEESKSFTCSFKEYVNGCELNYLNDLVKTFIEVNGNSIKITFRGFVFVPEHTSGSEMSMFNVVYEFGEKSKKLYFDNPLREPCETSEGEVINAFLETRSQVGVLGGLNP
ncbi:MAG: hypothetical protein LM560_02175 [Desulfurococcaceae archaeon]|jgi:hypothetical protein|nr:hypothetical protein [Desulfurococcaceae archaeon]